MKYCGEDRQKERVSTDTKRKKEEHKKAMRRKSGSRRMCACGGTKTREDEGENQHPEETVREVGEERSESRRSWSVKCEGAVLPRYRPTGHLRGNLVKALEACRCEGNEEGGRRKEEGERRKERREQSQQRLFAAAQEVESRRTV
jgi:hypothetical protein